jgi:hypothetical protein
MNFTACPDARTSNKCNCGALNLLIRHDWIAIQKNNRRFFDFLRYAPVAQNDSYLVCNRLMPDQYLHPREDPGPRLMKPPEYHSFAVTPLDILGP